MLTEERVSVDQPQLSQATKSRNWVARFLFTTKQRKLEEVYNRLNGSLEWSGAGWQNFVNSPELYDLVRTAVSIYKKEHQELFALCDPEGEWENVLFPCGIAVVCMPEKKSPKSWKNKTPEELERLRIEDLATRQVVKSTMHLFLKVVLRMDLYVMGNNSPFTGRWLISEMLLYEHVSDYRF